MFLDEVRGGIGCLVGSARASVDAMGNSLVSGAVTTVAVGFTGRMDNASILSLQKLKDLLNSGENSKSNEGMSNEGSGMGRLGSSLLVLAGGREVASGLASLSGVCSLLLLLAGGGGVECECCEPCERCER